MEIKREAANMNLSLYELVGAVALPCLFFLNSYTVFGSLGDERK